jgi:hypothetical protein
MGADFLESPERPLFHSIGFRRKYDATALETSRILQ